MLGIWAISTTNANHGNENAQDNNLEQNMQNLDYMCQNESGNMKQRFSNGKPIILLKGKVRLHAISQDENTKNNTIMRSMLRLDDLPQVESEGTMK
jgi:hypothetical protein